MRKLYTAPLALGLCLAAAPVALAADSDTRAGMVTDAPYVEEILFPYVEEGRVAVFAESFEGDDTMPEATRVVYGSNVVDGETVELYYHYYDWVPKGWERISKTTAKLQTSNEANGMWYVYQPSENFGYDAAHGDRYAYIHYDLAEKDEWLLSPEMTLGKEPRLDFYGWINPLYMHVVDDAHINWGNNADFIERVPSAVLQLMVLDMEDPAAEWKLEFDWYDEWADEMSLYEMLLAQRDEGRGHHAVELTRWADKKVRLAFRYAGTDGDNIFMDALTVSSEPVEGGLTTLGSASNAEVTARFTLDGRPAAAEARGIVVERLADGTARLVRIP